MILFHSDLDNTLIYSYKHDIGMSKKCVEIYQDREVSFMTTESMDILKRIQSKIIFVPTTTRTIEQYNRIQMGIANPKYALVCNGGILLNNGLKDSKWYEESLDFAEHAKSEIEKSIQILKQDKNRYFEIRFIEQLFVFTKTSEPLKTIQTLRLKLDENKVDIFQNGEKVYVLPKELNKGRGILRLKKKLSAAKIIAAGDSAFDIPMLKASDFGFCPKGLITEINSNVLEYPREVFTVKMLRKIESLLLNRNPDI
ncbi:HAD-IIB family hydrolase [Clostridium sp. E02]|uniref:HAD-IIB family hydrolase n=1 Tax=Clostridium sp. E02 TaxID=2487134 RepID=UPI0013DE14F1|nr:HAD-IIB family hydrolase [Clostridium sp. E02]